MAITTEQKKHVRSHQQAKANLKFNLSEFFPIMESFENGIYNVCNTPNYFTEKHIRPVAIINDVFGGKDVQMDCFGRSQLSVVSEVVIPLTHLTTGGLSGVWHTGRKLITIFSFRNSAHERYRMNLLYFANVLEEALLLLIKNCNLTDGKNYFKEQLEKKESYYEHLCNLEIVYKNLAHILSPFLINVLYLDSAATDISDSATIARLNNKIDGDSRQHTCFRALAGGDFGALKQLFKDVSNILFFRFKREQETGIIPATLMEWKEEYKKREHIS